MKVVALLIGLLFPFCVLAVDLEDEPDKDLGDVDRASSELSAKDIKVIKFETAEGKPQLDGVLDDPFWEQAQKLEITKELYPNRFADIDVKTDILAVITKSHVYIGITAHDDEPEKMRSYFRQRDGVKDDDYVSIVIDATGNLRRKFEFRVNPHGALTDVLQDQVSNRYWYDWDTRWDAAAKITDKGYVVEMEIPIDSVVQPRLKVGEVPTWLVLFKRTHPRAVDRTFGAVYLFQSTQAKTDPSRRMRVDIIPHYIFHTDEERDPDEPFAQVKDHDNHEVGLDARVVIDAATKASVTINPNYTEVEADIARESINNPFVPFQPEKREFFQESRDLYTSFAPLVYTRNIDQPKYGLDVTHTGRKISTGAFWIADEVTELIMPDNLGSEKVTVDDDSRSAAFRYATGWKGSSIGFMGTLREGPDYSNYVAGIDGLINFGLDDKLRYQLMYSSTDYPASFADDLCEGDDCLTTPPPDDCTLENECDYTPYVLRADPTRTLNGHGIRVGYKHDSPKNLYWLNYFDYASDFRADLGFEKRTDYRQVTAAYGRNWYIRPFDSDEAKSRLRFYAVGNFIRSRANDPIEDGFDLWGEFRGSFQTVLRAGFRNKRRKVNRINQGDLSLDDINAPRFDEQYLQWYYEVSPFNTFTFNFDGRYGDIADPENIVLGKMFEIKPRITYHSGPFKIQLAHTLRNFDTDGARLWQEQFTTLKAAYHFSRYQRVRFLLLNDTTKRDAARFRAPGELPEEKERTAEFTYIYEKRPGLAILAGAKITLESDTETPEFSSEREVYIKVRYDFETRFPPTFE